MPESGLPAGDFRGTQTPTLPLEIQFLILDQILNTGDSGAKLQLRALAFICWAWAVHIQSLLFSHVAVESSNVDRFLSLLHRSKHLGQYVTSLVILDDIMLNSPEIHHFLPNIRTMALASHVLAPLTEHRSSQWSAVTSLSVKFCTLLSAQDLRDFLCSFPACERLEFAGYMYSDIDLLPGMDIAGNTSALHLKHIALEGWRNYTPQNVARWLAVLNITADHLLITLGVRDDCDASAYNMLLARVGNVLQDLEITELPEETDQTSVIGICVGPCTTLRILTLHLRLSIASAKNMESGLLALLQQISSPHLAVLTLRMSLKTPLPELPWEEIDILLSGHRFRALQQVVFEVAGPAQIEFEDGITGVMVGLHRRGLLDFKWGARLQMV
ncbi:hypothetical protein C8R44DRAFT_809898 [Mycena epipterygia]|nr:hypothetical protein C8R44DRAFT_809898 [Mycena epipterygia]